MHNLPHSTTDAAIGSDRLYGISMRPQELSLYGEKVTFSVRYSPIFDDENEETDRHYKLLVLEISADLGQGVSTGSPGRQLQLLKCGWELELTTPTPCRVGSLAERDDEVPLLLGRIAETVNDLARRAGLEAPLGPDLVDDLVQRYRADSAPI
jgi:hypothetical protein